MAPGYDGFGSTAAHSSLQAPTYAYRSSMPNDSDIGLASSSPSEFTFTEGMQDTTGQYGAHTWNHHMEGWDMSGLSSLLVTSPVSAERSTTSGERDDALPHGLPILPAASAITEQDDALPQLSHELPILPAASTVSLVHEPLSEDATDTPHTGTGHAQSKRQMRPPAARPIPSTKPTSIVNPTTAVTRTSKRIPIKSKRNDIADAIGSDGVAYVGKGKEITQVSQEARTSKRRSANIQERVIPSKYV